MLAARTLLPFVLLRIALPAQYVRQVDFRNYTYPLSGGLLGHSNLQWLSQRGPAAKPPIRLVNGSAMDDGSGFELESVTFGDVTGDSMPEAIVDLKWHSGGTQTTDYLYIFEKDKAGLRLLAFCHTGSRAYSGLYRAFAENGQLVVELFDPSKQQGDCCSTGTVITHFAWTGTRFEIHGKVQKRDLGPLVEQ